MSFPVPLRLHASSSGYYSGSAVLGAAAGYGSSVARGIGVNFSGSQYLGALGHAHDGPDGAKVNTFGADDTDKGEGAFGFRVGIYATEKDIVDGFGAVLAKKIEHPSTVNIVGARLAEKWTIGDLDSGSAPADATIALAGDQGANRSTYARAFALGEDFQICVGGRVNMAGAGASAADYGFTAVPANGQSNAVNVFGAIAPARDTKAYVDLGWGDAAAGAAGPYPVSGEEGVPYERVRESSLIVDSSWEVNVYGPVEGLHSIDVRDGALNLRQLAEHHHRRRHGHRLRYLG
jgi:hypothetical protein